jgi:hypothetical protein
MMKPIAAISLPLLVNSGLVSLFAQTAKDHRKSPEDAVKKERNSQGKPSGAPGKLFGKALSAS